MTIIIVQARLTSTRFPRKVLQDVHGKTVLRMCLERCKQARVDEVVLAVPQEATSDDLVGLWEPLYRPPVFVKEWDVLSRYYWCAGAYKADFIVRVTSDCPLIDPATIDEVVSLLKASRADYCCNEPSISGFGLEAFTFEALEKAESNTTIEREHVTPYMRTLPCQARFFDVTRPVKLSVDTPEDLDLIREIVGALGHDCRTQEIVRWLDDNRL